LGERSSRKEPAKRGFSSHCFRLPRCRGAGRADAAKAHFEQAIAIFEQRGETHAAARVLARLGEVMWDTGRNEEAVELMDRAFQVVSREEPDADLASLAHALGRVLYFSGEIEPAVERIEVALDIAESLWLPEVLSQALNTKSLTLLAKGRPQESVALLEYALKIALENDIPSASLRAYFNLAELALQSDRFDDGCEYVERGLALARTVGNGFWERRFLGQAYPFYALGEWERILANIDELPLELLHHERGAFSVLRHVGPLVHLHRGDPADARRVFDVVAEIGLSADVQERAQHAAGLGAFLHYEGRHEDALTTTREAMSRYEDLGAGSEAFREGLVTAIACVRALGDTTKGKEVLDFVEQIPRGKMPQYVHAHVARLRAYLAAQEGDARAADASYKRASGTFRELGVPLWLGGTLLEYGEWLVAQDRVAEAEPLLTEARELFERLEARPWIERVDRVAVRRQVPA
jgi:tetratricopeptide (TPR) repeat protein